MTVTLLSFWRNDTDRHLADRARHLLSKTCTAHPLRWLWIVGDSHDDTHAVLGSVAALNGHPAVITVGTPHPMDAGAVNIVRVHTGIHGADLDTHRRRFAATAVHGFAAIHPDSAYVLLHESDIQSPPGVIDQLLMSGEGEPCAGWPVIELSPGREQFYDIWAYRDLSGHHFTAHSPYSPEYRADSKFRVGSFGTVWLAPAHLVAHRRIGPLCVVDLCGQWRREGVRLWCDPRVKVVQPTNLWSPV